MGFKICCMLLSLAVITYGFPHRNSHENYIHERTEGPNDFNLVHDGHERVHPRQGALGPDNSKNEEFGPEPFDPREPNLQLLKPEEFGSRQVRHRGPPKELVLGPFEFERFGSRPLEYEELGPHHFMPEIFDPLQHNKGPRDFSSKDFVPVELDPRQFGPQNFGTWHFGPEEFHPRHLGTGEFGPRHFRYEESGPRHFGSGQFGFRHGEPNQLGPSKFWPEEYDLDNFEHVHFDHRNYGPRKFDGNQFELAGNGHSILPGDSLGDHGTNNIPY